MRFRQLAQFCCKAQAEAFAAQLAEAGIESLIRDPGSPFFSNTLAGDSCWVWVPVEDFDKAKAMTDDGRYSEDAVIEPLSLAEFQCPQCQSWGAFPADQTGLPVECMGCSRPFVLPMAAGRVGKPLPTGTTTKRLRLRRFVPADAPDLRDVRRDSSAVGHTGLDPLDMEGAEAEIVEVMKPAWIDGGIRCTFHRFSGSIQSRGLGAILPWEPRPSRGVRDADDRPRLARDRFGQGGVGRSGAFGFRRFRRGTIDGPVRSEGYRGCPVAGPDGIRQGAHE